MGNVFAQETNPPGAQVNTVNSNTFFNIENYAPTYSSHINDVAIYDTALAFFATHQNNLLIYKKRLQPPTPSTNPVHYPYRLYKFNTVDDNSLFGQNFGIDLNKTHFTNLSVYPKRLYTPNALNTFNHIHGAILSKKENTSVIHQFIYYNYPLANQNGVDKERNTLFIVGSGGAANGFNYYASDYSESNIQKIVVSRVYGNSFAGAGGGNGRANYEYDHLFRHNIWAVGRGVIKYFDGYYWVDFISGTSGTTTPSTKSTSQYSSYKFDQNYQIQVTELNPTKTYTSISVSDDAKIIWVGASDATLLKIEHKGNQDARMLDLITNDLTFTDKSALINTLIPPTDTITAIYFSDPNNGFLTTSSGYILKTTDGGTTWTTDLAYDPAPFTNLPTANKRQRFNTIFPTSNNLYWAIGKAYANNNTVPYTNKYNFYVGNISQPNSWSQHPNVKAFNDADAFSATNIPLSFNSGHYFKDNTDSLAFIVGDNGLIIKIPDTLFKINNKNQFTLTTEDGHPVYVRNQSIEWYPTFIQDNIPPIINLMSDRLWMKDTLSPYIKVAVAQGTKYKIPIQLFDNPNAIISQTTPNKDTFYFPAISTIPQYPKYGNPNSDNIYFYSNILLKPWPKIFLAHPNINNTTNIPDSFVINYQNTNFNFSLSDTTINLRLRSFLNEDIHLKIKQNPFIPEFVNIPASTHPSDKNNSSQTSFDTIQVSILGAFNVQSYPVTYYNVSIDNFTNKTTDTPVLRKAPIQNLENVNPWSISAALSKSIKDTINFTSKYNFINSYPILQNGTDYILDPSTFDTLRFVMTGPCDQDNAKCGEVNGKQLTKAVSIPKFPLVLGVSNKKQAIPLASFKLSNKKTEFNQLIPSNDPEYNDYTNKINDSIVFCYDGRLKNLDPNSPYKSACLDSLTDNYKNNFWTSIYGNTSTNYIVYPKYFIHPNPQTENKNLLTKKYRYRFLIKPNNNPTTEGGTEPMVRRIGDSLWTPNDTLKSIYCTGPDTLIYGRVCSQKDLIDLPFRISIDSINELNVNRVDTLAYNIYGYDNTKKQDGTIDTTLKNRTIKLIKIVQEKPMFKVIWSNPLGQNIIPQFNTDEKTTDDSLKIYKTDTLTFTGSIFNTNKDSVYLKMESKYHFVYRKNGLPVLDANGKERILPEWLDTLKIQQVTNDDYKYYEYTKLIFKPIKYEFKNTILDSFQLCNVHENICRTIYLKRTPLNFVSYAPDNTKTSSIPVVDLNGDSIHNVSNFKFSNYANHNGRINVLKADTLPEQKIYVFKEPELNWSIEFIDTTLANGQIATRFIDTLKTELINISTNQSYVKIYFTSIDSNHTSVLWKQKIKICAISEDENGTPNQKIFCDSTYILKDTVQNITITSATQNTSDIILLSDTLVKLVPFANQIIDSIKIAINKSSNLWDIKLPSWLQRIDLNPTVDSATKTVYFKTLDSNYTSKRKYYADSFIQVCKTFDRTRIDYQNQQDSFCKKLYIIQDTPTINYEMLRIEDQNADTMIFRVNKHNIDSIKIKTIGWFTIKYNDNAATIIEPTQAIVKTSDNPFKNLNGYNGPTDTVGNTILYFQTKNTNLSGTKLVSSLSACILNTTICKQINFYQQLKTIDVRYFRKDKNSGFAYSINDTSLMRFEKDVIDSIDVISDEPFEVYSWGSNGQWNNLGPVSDNQKLITDGATKDTLSIKKVKVIITSDSVYNRLTLNSDYRHVGVDRKLDSIKFCMTNAPENCKIALIQKDTPYFYIQHLSLKLNNDTINFDYRTNHSDSLRVFSNSDWLYLDKDFNPTTQSRVGGALTANVGDKKEVYTTTSTNFTTNVIFDTLRICVQGIDGNSSSDQKNKYCRFIYLKQDTPFINLSTNKLVFEHRQNTKLNIDVLSNADWEWQYKNNPSLSPNFDTTATTNLNFGNKTIQFFTKNRNTANTPIVDTIRVCVKGINNTSAPNLINKYCDTLILQQDTAKLAVFFPNKQDTLYFGYLANTIDSIKIVASDTIEVFEIGYHNGTNVFWADINPTYTTLTPINNLLNYNTKGYVFQKTSFATLAFQSIERNPTKTIRTHHLLVKIKNSDIQKSIVFIQDTPFIKTFTKKIKLGRKALERQAIIRIGSNTGWKLLPPKNTNYTLTKIEGNSNLVYNDQTNYDSLNAYLNIRALNDIPYLEKSYDTILFGNPSFNPIILDTVFIERDSAYLNFEFATTNTIGSQYPQVSYLDSSIIVDPIANDQYKVKIFGNINKWKAYNSAGSVINSIHWNTLKFPQNFDKNADSQLVIMQVFDNESFEMINPRVDTLDFRGVYNNQEKSLLKLKIKQVPLPVPINNNFLIYPTPVKDKLIIKSKNFIPNQTHKGYVYIYAMDGNLIAQTDFTNGLIDFDFSILNTGFYVLKIFDGNLYHQQLILKQ